MNLYFYVLAIYNNVSIISLLVVILSFLISFIKEKINIYTYIYLFLIIVGTILSRFLLNYKEFILFFIENTFLFTFSLFLNDDLSKISSLSIKVLSIYILYSFIVLLLSVVLMFIYR